jgi:hypothetical protein
LVPNPDARSNVFAEVVGDAAVVVADDRSPSRHDLGKIHIVHRHTIAAPILTCHTTVRGTPAATMSTWRD